MKILCEKFVLVTNIRHMQLQYSFFHCLSCIKGKNAQIGETSGTRYRLANLNFSLNLFFQSRNLCGQGDDFT